MQQKNAAGSGRKDAVKLQKSSRPPGGVWSHYVAIQSCVLKDLKYSKPFLSPGHPIFMEVWSLVWRSAPPGGLEDFCLQSFKLTVLVFVAFSSASGFYSCTFLFFVLCIIHVFAPDTP